jgi:cell division protein FtsB
MWSLDKQIEQNAMALAELSATNRRLEATIAENEDLHRQLLVQAPSAGRG